MVHIHIPEVFCPADWTEIKNLFDSAEYFPASELLDALKISSRVMQNSPAGYAKYARSTTQDLTALTDGAQELFASVTERLNKVSKNELELQFLAVTDTTIPELQKIIFNVFNLLAPNTSKPLEPLAADLAQLTKGLMYVDHATHADLYVKFSCDTTAQAIQRQFGYDGFAKRDLKDGTSHFVIYHGDQGIMVKLVPDYKTAWRLFETYHGRGPNSSGETDYSKLAPAFAKLIESIGVDWAYKGDIFSYVCAGSHTPPALISQPRSGPHMLVKIEPRNDGWFNHGLHKGAELHVFSRGRLEEIFGHRISL